MKKLYFLNEEEKQRILKLHKSRQVGKFWLNEQHDEELDEQSAGGTAVHALGTGALGAGTAAAIGGAVTAWAGGVGAIPGAIIGGIGGVVYGLVTGISSATSRDEFNKGVLEACSKGAGKPTLSNEKMTEISKKLHDYINTQNWGFVGLNANYATEASRAGIRETLLSLPTLPDICTTNQLYEKVYGISLLDDLKREFRYEENYNTAVKYPITLAINTSIDLTKQAEEGEEVIDLKTGKKMKIKGKEASTYTATDLTAPFVENYPCFAGIAMETRDKNMVYILNPSSHKTIIDVSDRGGMPTTIAEKTFFKNDGTYYKSSDRKKVSGTFECGFGGDEILLTPTSAGVGAPEGIMKKYPCLSLYNIKQDGEDTETAIMKDESRAKHEELSKYPKGDIYFSINGEFLTDVDERMDKDMTGTFKCVGKRGNRLRVTTATQGDWDAKPSRLEPKYKLTGEERPKNRASGMGVVSASPSYITEILKCAKIGGSTLDQNKLNQLYDYIKNNK